MEDDLFMMALFSREGEGGQFFCIDDANVAGEPLKCPGGYHTGEQRTKKAKSNYANKQFLGKSVLVVRMSALLVNASAMVSSESGVTVNTPGQREGHLIILKN